MKTLNLKMILTLAAIMITAGVSAQYGPEWGDTDEQRLANVIEYQGLRDFYNNKDYDGAIPYMQKLMDSAPKGHLNIYIYGVNMYKNKAENTTDLAQKEVYVDSLLLIYDRRMEHFGEGDPAKISDIMRRKSEDYYYFKGVEDLTGTMQLYKQAIDMSPSTAPADYLSFYFYLVNEQYKKDDNIDSFMAEYEYLEPLINATGDQAQISAFENILVTSPAANCENIEKIYTKKFADDPTNITNYNKAIALLSRAKCNNDFFLQTAEAAFKLEPTADLAIVIANIYSDAGDNNKALSYLRENLALQQDNTNKAKLLVRIAATELVLGRASTAGSSAREAIALDPSSGLAYQILASAYSASGGACSDDFARKMVNCLAYDTMSRARTLLAEAGEDTSGADRQMASFRANFPTQEDGFFLGFTQSGQAYRFENCGWLSGNTTTVRFRQ